MRRLAIEHQEAARKARDANQRRHLEMMASHFAALAAAAAQQAPAIPN